MIGDINIRINEILTLCQAANEASKAWGSKAQEESHKALWKAIGKLEEDAGDGVVPGKFVKFAVADNYARYIVKEVGPKKCKLVHLPFMDAYRSSAVDNRGNCPKDEIEGRIEFEEGIRKLFRDRINKQIKEAKACKPMII